MREKKPNDATFTLNNAELCQNQLLSYNLALIARFPLVVMSLIWQAVYVAPLKALARERLKDWREKFEKKMGMGVLELTGDNTPDVDALR